MISPLKVQLSFVAIKLRNIFCRCDFMNGAALSKKNGETKRDRSRDFL